jgi:hypothetical protein
LGRVVSPVLRNRIDLGRAQQAELVVQAQRPCAWPAEFTRPGVVVMTDNNEDRQKGT